MDKKRLIIGMSGALGAPLAVEVLKQLKEHPRIETHLVVTRGAEMTLCAETDVSMEALRNYAGVFAQFDLDEAAYEWRGMEKS